MSNGQAVAVILITPWGIPLVRNPRKTPPQFWKLPGGKGESTETAKESAIREMEEETGASLSVDDLKVVHREFRGDHFFTIFQANLPVLPQLKQRGDEGEEIKVFTPQEIIAMEDLLLSHRRVVKKILTALL